MPFSFFQRRRRRKLLSRPFPEETQELLRRNVVHTHRLPEPLGSRLRDVSRIFIAEKVWEGCGGMEITDEVRITIAAQAGLMVIGFDEFYWEPVRNILVYPGSFLVSIRHAGLKHLAGEAHHDGLVVLSWKDALAAGRGRTGSSNLVVHEFAHQLDFIDREADGMPPIGDPDLARRWREVVGKHYDDLVESDARGRDSLLDPYGARSKVEFFAVASECFFQDPVRLRRQLPELYALLAEWYRQDPAVYSVEREAAAAEDPSSRPMESHGADELDASIAAYSDAIRRHPDFIDGYLTRALLYLRKGKPDRAIADYTAAIRLAPERGDLYLERGVEYGRMGDTERGLEDLSRAIRLYPSYAEAYRERGRLRSQASDLKGAVADLSRAIEIDAEDDFALLVRGKVYLDLEKPEKALADAERLLRLNPEDVDALLLRGWIRSFQKDHRRAIADLDAALRLDPECAAAYEARGAAWDDLGEAEKARRDRVRAREIDAGVPGTEPEPENRADGA